MSEPMSRPLRSYAVSIRGSDVETVVVARSAGAAKYQRFLALVDCCPDLCINQMRARSMGAALVEPAGFRDFAERRGIPFARVGMRVMVDGQPGVIVGHNASGNLDVILDGHQHPSNCHPSWRVVYLRGPGGQVMCCDDCSDEDGQRYCAVGCWCECHDYDPLDGAEWGDYSECVTAEQMAAYCAEGEASADEEAAP